MVDQREAKEASGEEEEEGERRRRRALNGMHGYVYYLPDRIETQ